MDNEYFFTSKIFEDTKYLDSKSYGDLSPRLKLAVQDTFSLIERTSGDIITKFESSVDKVAEARKINKEELYKYFDNEVNEQLGE
jgi:hypothetical protein|tara:strand:- start:24556 stop:24810 length:255 start_codon:yes stop_codon:yes gene_type:complete